MSYFSLSKHAVTSVNTSFSVIVLLIEPLLIHVQRVVSELCLGHHSSHPERRRKSQNCLLWSSGIQNSGGDILSIFAFPLSMAVLFMWMRSRLVAEAQESFGPMSTGVWTTLLTLSLSARSFWVGVTTTRMNYSQTRFDIFMSVFSTIKCHVRHQSRCTMNMRMIPGGASLKRFFVIHLISKYSEGASVYNHYIMLGLEQQWLYIVPEKKRG